MLDEVRISNYKSLRDVRLPLRAFNVFIGPNNSGKSNVFDCLQFLGDLIRQPQGAAVHGRGGYSTIVWNGEVRRSIEIEVRGYQPSFPGQEGTRHKFLYLLALSGGQTHFQIAREHFSVWLPLSEHGGGAINKTEADILTAPEGRRVLLEFPAEGQAGMVRVWDPTGEVTGGWGMGTPLQSFLAQIRDSDRYPLVGEFAQHVEGWGFYNSVPSLMQVALQVRRELRLQERAENFSTVLHSYHTEFPQYFRQIEELLSEAVPEVSALLTGLTEAGQTYVFTEERGLRMRIPSWAMSDGTLRLLAHLAVACSPSPPALVCFEEPENCVHPRALELLASALRKAASRTQVLLSTHSPHLLNFIEPEDVLVTEKKDGATIVSRVQNLDGIKEAVKTLGLGEMWYAGHLGGTT